MVPSEGWMEGVLTVEEELGREPGWGGAPSMEVGDSLFTAWVADPLELTAFLPTTGG